MTLRRTVVFSLLGTTLDAAGRGPARWQRWRPNVALGQHDDLLIDRLELLYQREHQALFAQVHDDLAHCAPETEVRGQRVEMQDPWDFETVYTVLHDFCRHYPFDSAREQYLVQITTGTHVAQICLFLLTEARYFPARLLQLSPPSRRAAGPGAWRIIDLDLSRYDAIATRFAHEQADSVQRLKSGIATRNAAFNRMIVDIETVAMRSHAPILLMGPTGAGKSQLARRIVEIKQQRQRMSGELVEVNCATLRGDSAMSTLFGHVKGAFTGAQKDRDGLLRAADGGVLFLDEVGELGLDEQAMLLLALEEKRFVPMGADRPVQSDFQLIAGTNTDLREAVRLGRFRADLLARINLWTFTLPGLRERREDIEPNLEYELQRFAEAEGQMVRFNVEAREKYLQFSCSDEARWQGNFRDLNASLTRMATLAPAGRITLEVVDAEIHRLQSDWSTGEAEQGEDENEPLLAVLGLEELDRFDRVQLLDVLRVCRRARSLSEAGRTLFAVSRARKETSNDADRLRKYLARFGLSWKQLCEAFKGYN